jgi:hypothetical protein
VEACGCSAGLPMDMQFTVGCKSQSAKVSGNYSCAIQSR